MKKFLVFFLFLLCLSPTIEAQVLNKPSDESSLKEYNWLFQTENLKECKANPESIHETKISECAFVHAFRMFPNPADDLVTINFEIRKGLTQLIISDLNGRSIYSEQINADELDEKNNHRRIAFDKSQTGIFLVSLIQDAEIFTKKLVVK